MTVQTFYPVFESGQVLTEAALNDIIDYLEPQDRLSRSRLTGIGVACGLHPDWQAAQGLLHLSKGVAVTSEGYLIELPQQALNRARPYLVPLPSVTTATQAELTEARYPFLFNGATQHAAWELLPPSFIPAPGEAAPTALTSAFLADKTVLLFLERRRDTLKNCDVNDCTDKGSSMSLTLRRLLVTRTVANQIIAQEAALTTTPVDRNHHPRLGLERLAMPRLNVNGENLTTYAELYTRQTALAFNLFITAKSALQATDAAYRSVVSAEFTAPAFPDSHLLPMFGRWAQMPILSQTLYDAAHHLTLAANEFLDAAALFDAECAPVDARFPRHVLLGDTEPAQRPFAGAPQTITDLLAFDPLSVQGGPSPDMPPVPRRHHFVPASVLTGDIHAQLMALYRRVVLLAQSYFAVDLVGAEIKISPSRDGAAALGHRAIPAGYLVNSTSALVANWSWPCVRQGQQSRITGYHLQSPDPTKHPARIRDDAVDFLRIEGVVGHTLGSTWAKIVQDKRLHGLSFAVQPVMVLTGDVEADQSALQSATLAMKDMLKCQTTDLDTDYRIKTKRLLAFLVWLMRKIGTLDAHKTGGRAVAAIAAEPETAIAAQPAVATLVPPSETRLMARASLLRADPVRDETIVALSDSTMVMLHSMPTANRATSMELVKAAVLQGQGTVSDQSVISVYGAIVGSAQGGELVQQVRDLYEIISDNPEQAKADAEAAYPAIALMKHAEAVMNTLRAADLGEFDQNKYAKALAGLQSSYSTYVESAQTDPKRVDRNVALANREIVENQVVLASVAEDLATPALMAELQSRLTRKMAAATLPTYAAFNPALEHKAGVPVGGTLILLYCHRDLLEQAVGQGFADFKGKFEQIFQNLFGQSAPSPDFQAALDALKNAQRMADDPLEDFVVLGDLCLPTMCCDAECAEAGLVGRYLSPTTRPAPAGPVEPAQPAERPIVVGRTGTVTGRVVSRTGPVVGATIVFTSQETTARPSTKSSRTGTFSKALPPGKYTVIALIDVESSSEVMVEVTANTTQSIELIFR